MRQIVAVDILSGFHFCAHELVHHRVVRMANRLYEVVGQIIFGDTDILFFPGSGHLRLEFQRICKQVSDHWDLQRYRFGDIHDEVIVFLADLSVCSERERGNRIGVVLIHLDKDSLPVLAAVSAAALALVHADGVVGRQYQVALADDRVVKAQASSVADVRSAFACLDLHRAVYSTDLIQVDIPSGVEIHVALNRADILSFNAAGDIQLEIGYAVVTVSAVDQGVRQLYVTVYVEVGVILDDLCAVQGFKTDLAAVRVDLERIFFCADAALAAVGDKGHIARMLGPVGIVVTGIDVQDVIGHGIIVGEVAVLIQDRDNHFLGSGDAGQKVIHTRGIGQDMGRGHISETLYRTV